VSIFVFLFVGRTTELPTILVRSLRAANPDSRIIQCSDTDTPPSEADEVVRFSGDTTHLMTFRLRCFSELALDEPAMYLDVDMVCLRRIEPQAVLGDFDVAVCKREYGLGTPALLGKMDLSEYDGLTIGQVWPYIACCTVARSQFWADCYANLLRLDPKFHAWFGDQEAIRNVVATGKYRARYMMESIYAHIPYEKRSSSPRLLHFKGTDGKAAMLDWARQRRLL
jgi:hypothetical protein